MSTPNAAYARGQTFTEEEAWDHSARFAAPHCRRCHGSGMYWIYMGGEQSALHLCRCVRSKKGFVPGINYGSSEAS